MESHKLVRPEHLNHYGFLFGGYLLQWVDEAAYVAVTLDFPGGNFLTVGMDRVEFKKSVRQGAILRFCVERARTGRTSAHYLVQAFVGADPEPVFSTRITFVCVDAEGRKRPLPGPPARGGDGDCARPGGVL